MSKSTESEPGPREPDVCGSTDTHTGTPCQRQVGHPEAECPDHRGPGAPPGNDNAVGHGAPPESLKGNQNALKNDGGAPEGNANALIHGRTLAPEDLRETFDAEERTMLAALCRDYREGEREVSAPLSEEMATARVMFNRLTVELLDESGMLDVRKVDALRAYGDDLGELEDKAADERERRKEQQTRRYVEILAGLPAGGFDDLVHDREPPSEESATDDPTTDIEREIEYESLTPNPNTTLAQPALADGRQTAGDPPEDSADEESEPEDEPEDESEDESEFRVPMYTTPETLVR